MSTVTGSRLGDLALHAAPVPGETSSVSPGTYYRILRYADRLAVGENVRSWHARTPDGEWVTLRLGDRGCEVEEHEDGTITVNLGVSFMTPRRARWTLIRGEWKAV